MAGTTLCLWVTDPLEASLLARACANGADLRVVVAHDAAQARSHAAVADVLVVEVGSDDELAPIVRQLRGLNPSLRVLALSRSRERDPVPLLEQGFTDVLGPGAQIDDVRAHARALAEGGVLLEPAVAERVVRRLQELSRLCEDQGVDFVRCGTLSPREREVSALIGRGLTNEQIAGQLSVSPGTVKSHVHNILRKLDVESRRLAGAYWRLYSQSDGGKPHGDGGPPAPDGGKPRVHATAARDGGAKRP